MVGISVGSSVYAFVLLLTLITLIKNEAFDPLTQFYPVTHIGPGIKVQLFILWLYNFTISCYFFYKQIQDDSDCFPALRSSVSALLLLLLYQNLLWRLQSIDLALYSLIHYTILVLAIVAVTGLIRVAYNKFLNKSENTKQ